MGHHGDDHAAGFARAEHVLYEHEVALLAGRRAPSPAKPLGKLHVGPRIVLAEGRIGDHPVEAFQLAGLAMQRMQKSVFVLNVGPADAMEHHVDLADGPR